MDSALGLPETAKVDQARVAGPYDEPEHLYPPRRTTAPMMPMRWPPPLRDNIQQRQWMCGFPDKVAVAVVGEYVVSVFGAEDLVNTFMSHLNGIFGVQPVYDEAIL